MATQTTERNESMTDGQATQVKRLLEDASKYAFGKYTDTDPTKLGAQRLIGFGDQFKEELAQLLLKYGAIDEARADWQAFYKEHFGLHVDFNRVMIPACPGEGWRLIFIPKGMTMNKAFAQCKKLFATWQYADDLDKAIPTNARVASDHYAVWVRDGIEPDAEHLGKSTKAVDPDMKIGSTLLERIILEVKYFSETGNHLDIKGVTLCSGSRNSEGGVPLAHWFVGEFGVRWCALGDSYSTFGVRSAVSL